MPSGTLASQFPKTKHVQIGPQQLSVFLKIEFAVCFHIRRYAWLPLPAFFQKQIRSEKREAGTEIGGSFSLCDKYKHESANAIHEKNDGWIDSE